MIEKNFAIDFVRQLIEQTLEEEHKANPTKYYGGKNQVNLMSFYEQLKKEDEVNRYVEIYRDLTEQQNRTGLIMNGTIIAPENPTITNLYNTTIIPLSYTCSFRVKLADRDKAIYTINRLIEILKGKHFDIAEFNGGTLFKVGTIGNGGVSVVKNGDYIGSFGSSSVSSAMASIISSLSSKNITLSTTNGNWYYFDNEDNEHMGVVLRESGVWKVVSDDGTYEDIVFPPVDDEFSEWRVSVSCDSIRCDEPRNLNADEYCVISFGGSATITDKSILGNELVRLQIKKDKIVDSPSDISITSSYVSLEPLELPSGSNANTMLNQLRSNNFINNTHTDSLNANLQYTFMVQRNIDLIQQWFEYARYGIVADGSISKPWASGISPNMIYKIRETWSSWGIVKCYEFNAKIIESIDIENTESDTLTITIPFQVQGDNN